MGEGSLESVPRDRIAEHAVREAYHRSLQQSGRARGAHSLFWREETSSTMDDLRGALQDGVSLPCTTFASRQSSGRGRHGNRWQHADSALTFTTGLSSFSEMSACLGLSLVVGIVVAEFFRDVGVPLLLKWPNDLLSDAEEKVGGILIEMEPSGDGVVPLIGIGINLGDPPRHMKGGTSELPPSGLRCGEERYRVAGELLARLEGEVQLFADQGSFASYQERFHEYAAYLEQEIIFSSGQEQYRGVFTGVSRTGALCVQLSGDLLGESREFHSAEQIRVGEGNVTRF